MTLKELYEKVLEKKENAIKHRERIGKITPENYLEHTELKGEIEAYEDVLNLIESSEILNEYKTKCPICNGKVEIHYNQNQIEVYECQNEKCGFEYPVRQDHIKRWKYGNGWWSKGL